MKATDLMPADYNPRKFSDKALKGLNKSMQEFADISGITWNKKTKNIVTGHHRWKLLCDTYGMASLKFKEIKGTDKLQILHKKSGSKTTPEDTGYILRVVDWDANKEKAANVMANSQAITGVFTADLQDIIGDIKLSFDDVTFGELNLSDLELPTLSKTKNEEGKDRKKKKSETVISGGGETYRTVKLELSPELAERFRSQLERFQGESESVEGPLEMIVSFLENKEDSEILPSKVKRKRK